MDSPETTESGSIPYAYEVLAGSLEEPDGTARPPRIMMIDDDEDDHFATQDLLREVYGPDFVLEWASTWEAAVDAVSRSQHDLYLLDYFLGERDGVDLVREGLTRGCEVPIILLTGRGSRDVDHDAMRAGAADYLVKGESTPVMMERSIRYAMTRQRGKRRMKHKVSSETPNILLIDDDEDDYILTRGMLSEIYGGRCKLDWVDNWEKALQHISDNAHDAYLVDYRLGKQNGIDLVREALARGCQAPVILLTGESSREVDLEAMRAGASDFLVKSEITAPLLDRAIRYAMERFRGEQRLTELAKFDQLTGLANRFLFREFLTRTLARAERYHRSVAVVFLDLDRFKLVNDTLGHHAGDGLLQGVAERLRNCVRASDIVARLGGDEFAVVLDEITDPFMIGHFCERILKAIRQPFPIDGEDIRTSTSIGVAVYPMDADNIDDLLKSADTAMYHAKEAGSDNFQFYTMSMHLKASKIMALEKTLNRALERKEFALCYQPQVDRAGMVVGFEALLRWNHPERGVIAAKDFIQVAEETGLIVPIGRWVLREACLQAKAWHDAGFPPFCVAVNVAPRQFRDGSLIPTVSEVLEETGLPPKMLALEITETSILKNPESVLLSLRKLIDLGVGIALDDFGTGFSSLTHLKNFPGNTIKIDRSFVQNIRLENNDSKIVKAVVQMAHGLGLIVVAEGVETRHHFDILCEQECDQFQGFYFAKPLLASAIDRTLLSRNVLDLPVDRLQAPEEDAGEAGT
jgi:diguanylate cyclase (GGDEF)-like protein